MRNTIKLTDEKVKGHRIITSLVKESGMYLIEITDTTDCRNPVSLFTSKLMDKGTANVTYKAITKG